MRLAYCALLTVLLVGDALAQGLGLGTGTADLRQVGKAAALTPCATNFVFDWTPATGCNAITAVIP
jgi:hypothetical protein